MGNMEKGPKLPESSVGKIEPPPFKASTESVFTEKKTWKDLTPEQQQRVLEASAEGKAVETAAGYGVDLEAKKAERKIEAPGVIRP